MTISIDWKNGVIESTTSILDLPALHATLRDLESSETGVIYPKTHTWRALELGGGAFFYQMDLTAYYTLRFSGAGPFQISGNLKGPIVDTGVQVERTTSAAFSTTAVGGSGPSAESIAAAVVTALHATTIPVDAKKMNGHTIIGDGTAADKFRGAGV